MSNTIVEIEDGPLILKSDTPILVRDGEVLITETTSYLCRCGSSANKPFCDGEHKKQGFTTRREIKEELLQEYEGKDITVHFNRSICAGAGACVKGLPSVFISGSSSSWIHPNSDSVDNIINTIKACPSGALSYSLNGKIHIHAKVKPKITIVKDGPYNVEGISSTHKLKPTNFSETKYTLCRCGHSRNKPYCDYSHAEKEWKDS